MLRTVAVNNLQNVSWIMPAGIYPPEVFPAGLLYRLTYQTLKNLNNIQTLTTNETLSQLSVPMDDVYIVQVSASILKSNFGPEATTSFTTGKLSSYRCHCESSVPPKFNTTLQVYSNFCKRGEEMYHPRIFKQLFYVENKNTIATPLNSTAIMLSFRPIEYCGADIRIQYELEYRGVEEDTSVHNLIINVTNQTVNGGSCEPQAVNLTNLQVYTNYTISVRVTIADFDVNSLLVADSWSVTSEEGEQKFHVLINSY